MTTEAEVDYRRGHATLRGSPLEIAQVILYLHQNGMMDLPSVGLNSSSLDQRTPADAPSKNIVGKPSDVKNLLVRLRAISTDNVQTWVREHPKGNSLEFAKEILQSDLTYGGPTRAIYVAIYNKLARARRKVGLPPPTKVED
jgi:hypothetical protein